MNTPARFLPPEATFAKDSIGFPADVWSLACCIYEIIGDGRLFEEYFDDRDDGIREMISALGRAPAAWWDAWEKKGLYVDEDGEWRSDRKARYQAKSRPLSLRIQKNGREGDAGFTAAEKACLEKMMRSMLEWEPDKRPLLSMYLCRSECRIGGSLRCGNLGLKLSWCVHMVRFQTFQRLFCPE